MTVQFFFFVHLFITRFVRIVITSFPVGTGTGISVGTGRAGKMNVPSQKTAVHQLDTLRNSSWSGNQLQESNVYTIESLRALIRQQMENVIAESRRNDSSTQAYCIPCLTNPLTITNSIVQPTLFPFRVDSIRFFSFIVLVKDM